MTEEVEAAGGGIGVARDELREVGWDGVGATGAAPVVTAEEAGVVLCASSRLTSSALVPETGRLAFEQRACDDARDIRQRTGRLRREKNSLL